MPPTDDLLADLTDDQQAAVTHGEGPLLILAGAGSGKTRVITRRVAYLLQQGVRPSNILAITFTNKAAGRDEGPRREARARQPRVGQHVPQPRGAALRQYADRLGFDRNFTIYDMDDRNKLVKDALEAAGIDNVKFSPERIGGAISKAKNQLVTPHAVRADRDRLLHADRGEGVPRVREATRRPRTRWTSTTCSTSPRWRCGTTRSCGRELDARFQYVLIDEYQDTNLAQYEIAKRLVAGLPNLCVVGDPDQSIYKWRELGHPEHPRLRARLPERAASSRSTRTTAARRPSSTRPARSSTTTSSARRRRSSPTTRRASRSTSSRSTTASTRPRAS